MTQSGVKVWNASSSEIIAKEIYEESYDLAQTKLVSVQYALAG